LNQNKGVVLLNKIYQTMNELCIAGANLFVEESQKAILAKGRFSVALSGGATPRRLFQEIAKKEWHEKLEWDKIFIFWGDERFVPAEDEQSNQKMARESLLQYVPIPKKNIFPIPFAETVEQSAEQYEETLKQFFAEEWPEIDLVLLGMGLDGHTASLFPGSNALKEEKRWVVPSKTRALGPERITLTFPVLNHAALVCFVVTGKEKSEMVKRILQPAADELIYPAQGIQPQTGRLIWLLDESAAQFIS